MKTTKPSGKVAESRRSDGLHVGDVIKHDGIEQVVWFRNDCRAAVAPLNSPIEYRVREADGKLQFLAKGDSANISPNSEAAVLRSLGRKGLAEFIDTKKTKPQKAMSKDKKEKSSKPSVGKLGGYKGHSITSVIRAFGKAGWSLDEARAFFKKHEIEVADTTIKIQLRAGKIGEGGDPASFTKDELASMKPKVQKAEKSEKGGKKDKPAKKDKKDKKSKPAKEDDDETVDDDVEPPADDESGEDDTEN